MDKKSCIFRGPPEEKDTVIFVPYSSAKGKTTLARMLREHGYTVFEEHEVFVADVSQGGIDRLIGKMKTAQGSSLGS